MNPIDHPSQIPSGLETDPEASAKRTAAMQQSANPPFKGNLTIIWDDEKQATLQRIAQLESRAHTVEESIIANLDSIESRLNSLSQLTQALSQRVLALENHILNLQGSEISISRN